MSSNIAYQLSYTLDGQQSTMLLDTINDNRVSASSTLTTRPLVSGDKISDHIYREPVSVTITGTFAINGGTRMTMSANSKLINIEKLFERLKNEGVICTLVKLSTTDKIARFVTRDNMVLSSITWTEKINSLDFEFEFRQILTEEAAKILAVDIKNEVPKINEGTPSGTKIEQDSSDDNLPKIIEDETPAQQPTVAAEQVQWYGYEEIITSSINCLLENECMTKDFYKLIQGMTYQEFTQYNMSVTNAKELVSAIKKTSSQYDGTTFWKSLGDRLSSAKKQVFYVALFKSNKEKIMQKFADFINQIIAQVHKIKSNISGYLFNVLSTAPTTMYLDDTYTVKIFYNNLDKTYGFEVYRGSLTSVKIAGIGGGIGRIERVFLTRYEAPIFKLADGRSVYLETIPPASGGRGGGQTFTLYVLDKEINYYLDQISEIIDRTVMGE